MCLHRSFPVFVELRRGPDAFPQSSQGENKIKQINGEAYDTKLLEYIEILRIRHNSGKDALGRPVSKQGRLQEFLAGILPEAIHPRAKGVGSQRIAQGLVPFDRRLIAARDG